MKENDNQKLTLFLPITYQIKVPGVLDEKWLDWNERLTVTIESDRNSDPISTINITVDQAGLHGLLQYLYSLGLPLISVLCVDCT